MADALLISTRTREVWTTDEKKLINRVSKLFNMHGDKMLLVCGHPLCPDRGMKLTRDATNPAGAMLSCGCTDRVFTPTC